MTLEDFFTLTEMKDGLTALSRVHELVAVMQKEKDCIVKNVGDATRQWAAVASTIASTENRDCLDLFIQLDGLSFIDKWLKDAKKYGNDAADGFVEESLAALLRALEKLQIDKERSVSSGIWITVNNLLDHGSSRVQDGARALFDSWKHGGASDAVHHDGVGASHDASENSRGTEYAAMDVTLTKKIANIEISVVEPAKYENFHSRSSNCQPEEVKEHSDTNMEHLSPDPVGLSVLSNSIQDSHPLKEKVSTSVVDGVTLTEISSFSKSKGPNTESELDSLKKLSCLSGNLDMLASLSGEVEPGANTSVAGTPNAKENMAEPAMKNNVDAEEGNFGLGNMSIDAGEYASLPKSGGDDGSTNNHLSALALHSTGKDDCSPDSLTDSSLSNKKLEKSEDIGTRFQHMLDIGADVDDDDDDDGEGGRSSDGADFLRDRRDFTKSADTESPEQNNRRSDIETEYVMDDALVYARQVAQEVEREVVDYTERSCSSSSDKIMATDIRQPGSPDSINTKQGLCRDVPDKHMQNEQHQAAEVFPVEDARISSNNVETEVESGTNVLESSQVTEVAPEQEINTERGLCDFDLNQEVCSDDMERTVNPISTPISVVSASRPAVASGSPSAPLQFEGILGWKGSAATSAFRPASPRKTSDGDKVFETGGSSSSSKPRKNSLDFDLNVTEDGDEKMLDLMPGGIIPVSSGIHSGESSLEVGSRRSERPNLDLNRISNEGDVPQTTLRMEGQLFYPRNGHRSPSPAFSSSSSMQPSLRNFDLNDRPLFHHDSSDQALYSRNQNVSTFGISRPGDPVISILGTRVELGNRAEISRKDFIAQHPSLANGKPLDSIVDTNVAQMGGVLGIPTVPYAHSAAFGYNGLAAAPAMYGASGSIPPYMMDTRVASMVPQILSSASVPPYSQPSFIMNMAGAPPSLNGAVPPRPNFDLNSGFANEGGNAGGLRQFFMPGQSRSFEEHLRTNLQPSPSSGMGIKRREPDSGWESYSLPFKHPQPPWR